MTDDWSDTQFESEEDLAQHVEDKVLGSGGPLDPDHSFDTERFPDTLDEFFEDQWAIGAYISHHDEGVDCEMDRIRVIADHYDESCEHIISLMADVESDSNGQQHVHRRDSSVLEYFAEETEYTADEIADFLNLATRTVQNYLYEFDLQLTEKWNNSISWTHQTRKVREQDKYECVVCGRSEEKQKAKFGSELHVHHVVPRRFIEADETKHAVENLVSLCSRCHKEWEHLTPRELFKRAVES